MKRESPRRLIRPFAAVVPLQLCSARLAAFMDEQLGCNGDLGRASPDRRSAFRRHSDRNSRGAPDRGHQVRYAKASSPDSKCREADHVAVNQSLATMALRLLEPALAEARQALQKDQASLALAEASLHRAQALTSAQVRKSGSTGLVAGSRQGYLPICLTPLRDKAASVDRKFSYSVRRLAHFASAECRESC
jgi:hypothetical protein